MDYEVEEINNLRDEVAMLKERLAIDSEYITKLKNMIQQTIDTTEAEIEIIKEEVKKEVKKVGDSAYNFGVSIGVAQGRHEAAIETKLQKDVAETSFATREREHVDAEILLKEEGLN